MAKDESDIQARIMIALSKIGARVFRNNVGKGWIGKSERGQGKLVFVGNSDVVIRNARPFHAGLCVGSADLIGWVPVVVTQEMVGQTLAVFLSPEVKTAKGRPSLEQVRWREAVQAAGGRAGIARSPEEAVKIALDPR